MSKLSQLKKIRNIAQVLKAVRKEAEKQVAIAVIADPEIEAEILAKFGGAGSDGVVFGMGGLSNAAEWEAKLKEAELALVIISPGKTSKDLEQMVKQATKARNKLIVVTGRDINDWLADNLADVFRVSGEDVLFIPISDDKAFKTMLIPKVLNKIKGKEVALAAAVPAFKDEVARRIIGDTAKQNAIIGIAVFVPGADMPLLTVNQIKMVLRLSAVYNQELSVKRLYEILAVVGGGFAFREAARQTLSVIPVAGWAIKGGVAYGGTIAMGQLAKKYFEDWKGEASGPLAANRENIAESGEAKQIHKP